MDKVGGSRLLQMQARFQQKQLQEREHKIASLYEAQQARALERVRHSPSNGVYTPPSQLAAPPAQLAAPPAQLAAPPAQLAAPPAQLAAPPVTHQPGKVRQMFEERRTKAGIDKSYPLQPIQNTERTQQRKAIPNGYNKVTIPNGYNKVSTTNGHNKVSTTDGYNKVSTTNGYNKVTTTKAVDKKLSKTTISHTSINSNTIKKHSVTKIAKVDNIVNGTRDVNHNHQTDVNTVEVIPQSNGDISNHYKESKPTVDEPDNAENNYLIENETFPEALAPTPTPRSAESVEKTQQKKTAPPRQSKSPLKVKPQQPTASTPRRDVVERKTVNSRPATGMQRASNPTVNSRSSRVVQRASNPSGTNIVPKRSSATDGEGCAVCGRRFAPDRLAKHQEICKKTNTKRRKPYDVLKHRLAGTEAEPFINKLRKSTAAPSTTKAPPQNSNWRRKHEEFIQAIRAAKKVQAHLSAGGKLSDLPPPPPSENPDYVQCPHCSRRFNQGAAERHIPKCANFQFNKTKKPSPKRR